MQIICPLVAALLFGVVASFFALRGQNRITVRFRTAQVARELASTTNSASLEKIEPDLQGRLDALFTSAVGVGTIRSEDAPKPIGDGSADSHIILTNQQGMSLGIRLRMRAAGKPLSVAGFWTPSD